MYNSFGGVLVGSYRSRDRRRKEERRGEIEREGDT
jgi:hypothetical protein